MDAVCRSICGDLPAAPEDAARADFTCAWVSAQIGRMPRHYRIALRLAVALLGCSTLPRGRLLHRLPADGRRAVLARWRRSALGPRRDLVRFFDSLCTLAYFSSGTPDPRERA